MPVRTPKASPSEIRGTEHAPASVVLTVEALEAKKARDLVVLDLRTLTDVADYFVICTVEADTHARAAVEAVSEALLPIKRHPWHVEGADTLTWVLVDFVDVVVHVFREDARQFYALEEMWADAPRVALPEVQREELTRAARSGRN